MQSTDKPIPALLGFLLAISVMLLPSATSAADPIIVQTYNIRYLNTSDGEDIWSARSAAVVATISGADLVGLQEVVAEQLADIRKGTSDFQWYGVGRDDGKQKGEMTPVGWRRSLFDAADKGTFWLSEEPESAGKKSWDAALPRIASWVRLVRKSDQSELLLVNTHFDHVGKVARRNSAKLIRRWIAEHRGDSPVVLIGDLNAELGSPPLAAFLLPGEKPASALVDAISISESTPTGPNSTWNGFRSISEGRRIDHVLAAGDLKIKRYTTLDPRTAAGRFASDHLPVQVAIEF